MASSFPYFTLSRHLRLPYAQILDKVRQLEEPEPVADSRRLYWRAMTPGECDAIYDAWRGEVNRRRKVMEESRR